uniref:DDE-type integrase/transposase/recombinase n=1 Tax=Streptomyces sp. WZ-12 TaxID=3030210 RepID=UPI00238147DB|nr:DDE-type integrase/transposase/recombinase [Streptomyces sp. WZ-12]
MALALDVFSRMIIGWQVANRTRTELPLEAPDMALWRRRIKKDSGRIHRSDPGPQCVYMRYANRLAEIGTAASVGSGVDSYGNAMAEALNGTPAITFGMRAASRTMTGADAAGTPPAPRRRQQPGTQPTAVVSSLAAGTDPSRRT